MAEEQKRVNFIDDTYIIPEMLDNIDAANENCEKVIKQQEFIIELVEKDARSKDIMPGFKEAAEKQIVEMKEKIRVNTYQKECLSNALAVAKNSQEARFVLSMLLEATGIVNREALPYEKRPELAIEEDEVKRSKEGDTEKKDA